MANSIAKLAIVLNTDTSGMLRGFQQARAESRKLAADLNGVGGGAGAAGGNPLLGRIGSSFGAGALGGFAMQGAVQGAHAFADWVKWSVQLAEETKEASINFRVMMGDAAQAAGMINGLRRFALQSSFSQGELQHAAQTMLAFGMAGDKVIPTLRTLGDISMGNSNKLKLLTLAFSQTQAAGRLMGQDLLQMVNAGFNPLQEISRVTGLSMAELKKHMEDGAISAEMVATAFKTATEQGGRFNNAMLEQQNTLKGQWSMLKEQFGEGSRPIGAGISDVLMVQLKGWNQLLEFMSTGEIMSDEQRKHFAEMAKPLKGHAEQLKAMAAELKKSKEETDKAAKAMEAMKRDGDALTKALRTPGEIFVDSLLEAKKLLEANVITAATFDRSASSLSKKFMEAAAGAKTIKAAMQQTPTVRPLSRFSGESQVAIQEARNARTDDAANRAREELHRLKIEEHNRKMELMIDKILREVKDSKPVILEEASL
jgi:tape measure domain-containing protein